MALGINDRTVLCEIARFIFVPISDEPDGYICFNRIASNICHIGGGAGEKNRRLYAYRRKLESNGYIRVTVPSDGPLKGIDTIVLTNLGWEVVDGKKE